MPESKIQLRDHVSAPPRGWARLRWWGPGVLWAISAVGSGSVLFTPRVGSRYGYELLWVLLLVCVLMWVMIREAARFTIATGRTLLDGLSTLPGPRNWALWLIFVPQLVAAVVGVAGLSALVGSALQAELPGGHVPWALALLGGCTLLVVSGGYMGVSRVARVLAVVLVGVTVAAAAGVFPSTVAVATGVRPSVPSELSLPFVLPWVGTILAGSMGIVWFSYWAATRGYGGGAAELSHGEHEEGEREGREREPLTAREREHRIRAWLRTMSHTAALGVVLGTLVIFSFLVLGTELLGPVGIVPAGSDVALELTRLLSELWGRVGYWLMMAAILIALGGSVLANQDGWARSFADITLLLPLRGGQEGGDEQARGPGARWLERLTAWRPAAMHHRRALKILYALVLTGLLPAAVILTVRDPVRIMSASGIVATVHTPFVAFVTLSLNRRLPESARPGWLATGAMMAAGLFYTGFAVLYFLDLAGLLDR